jgi:hypothetical protein
MGEAMRTYVAILEYCGGVQTDRLYRQMARWNPEYAICVLDNASPRNRCHCITVQNETNTFIGGGIVDCLRLAEQNGASYLFLIMNDVKPLTPLDVRFFEGVLDERDNVVQIAPAVARPSGYPWMMWQPGGLLRHVPHSDIFCSMFRLEFIRCFGGFPKSKGAWGYDWEIAYHSRWQGKTILMSDSRIVDHTTRIQMEAGTGTDRAIEMDTIYRERYADFGQTIRLIKDEYFTPNNGSRLR